MVTNKSVNNSNKNSITNNPEAFQALLDISKLLNTGLNENTLRCCVGLLEQGNNPEALATIVREMKKQIANSSNQSFNSNSSFIK